MGAAKRGLCLVILIATVLPVRVAADGGTVQFRERAGPYLVTLFATPSPLRAGPADLSVLVETAEGRQAVLDARVRMKLSHARSSDISVHTSHQIATNKLLYAALPALPSAGRWNVEVDVERNGAIYTARGSIEVLAQPSPWLAYWPYFAVIPAAIGLYILNRRLRTH